MANTVAYAFEDFKRDLSLLVDESYSDRLNDLVKITGAKLEGASSNPSPTGTLLDILTSQAAISEDNISVLVTAFEEANMTKATELSIRFNAGLSTAQSKEEMFKEQLRETYQKMCQDSCSNVTSKSGVLIASLPALTITTDCAEDGVLLSRHDIFWRLHPEHPYLVLIGDTGSGKTTLCHRLLHDWVNKDKRSYLCDVEIVIFTSLSHVNLRASLAESIRDSLLPPDTTLCDKDIEDIIVSHLDSLLFIFDSLDDLSITDLTLDHHSKNLEIGKILTGHQVPFIPKLVTSSHSLSNDHPCEGIDFFLSRLQPPQIKDYVTKYFSTEPKVGANVFHHVSKSSVTSDFCEIPLLLRMICVIAKRENSIRIGEVLHMHVFVSFVVQNTFEVFCSLNGINEIDFVQFSRVLGHLALETLLKKQRVDIKTKRSLAEDEKPMIGLGLKAGFMKEVNVVTRDRDGSVSNLTFIRFKNRLLQQFFAAARLTEVFENSPDTFNEILDAITSDESFHYLRLFICGNSALCCRSILNKINGVEIHRTSTAEYLYECQEADGDDSHLLPLFRWLSSSITISGNMSKYQQRATFSLIQRMRNAKVNISSLHLSKVTSSLCIELMKVGAPIKALTICDVRAELFRDLPACATLRKLVISDVEAGEDDLLLVFKWVSQQEKLICVTFKGTPFPRQPSTHFAKELKDVLQTCKYKVFREEDGDSCTVYNELNTTTLEWKPMSPFEFCKYQFESGLMTETELRQRTKQSNIVSRRRIEANCVPHSNSTVPRLVPEIVLEDFAEEPEEEEYPVTDEDDPLLDKDESLLATQRCLHAGRITIDEFMRCLQRLHGRKEISTSQYVEEIRILRNIERIDADTCFHMILSVGDTIQDTMETVAFMEDIRQLARFGKITTTQLLQICHHLISKAQLSVDDYITIIGDMRERKEVTKDQFIAELDALKSQKLIGQLAYIKLRLSS